MKGPQPQEQPRQHTPHRLYLVLSVMIPRLVKKPTGIKIVDDFIMYLVAQKGFLMSGTILVMLTTYFANYINLKMMGDSDI